MRFTTSISLAAFATFCCSVASAGEFTYQIDNGNYLLAFNNTLGTEPTPNQAEDCWVANVFTAVAGANVLHSISFQTAGYSFLPPLNSTTLPSPFVTAALYTGAPGTGLTLVPGSVDTIPINAKPGDYVTVPFATVQVVSTGQVFTAALLIDDVPVNIFPFTIDTSNNNVGSYYDVSNPIGSVNNYNLGSPNNPTLNGDTYPGQPPGATNAFVGVTLLRVNASPAPPVPEPTSLALAGLGVATIVGFGWLKRRQLQKDCASTLPG